jgi:superfamily I DNA and RNA helicase
MHFDSQLIQILFYVIAAVAAVVLLFLGYQAGRMLAGVGHRKVLATKEQELFTTQKGFRTLYETELSNLKSENASLKEQVQTLVQRVDEYRKKAAGYGGLFTSGGKRAEAMYALLLENEAMEEALYAQNEKLRQERTDALKEQLRNTGYRRVLISQLLNDQRIKEVVSEILSDERRLPKSPNGSAGTPNLPATTHAHAADSADHQG